MCNFIQGYGGVDCLMVKAHTKKTQAIFTKDTLKMVSSMEKVTSTSIMEIIIKGNMLMGYLKGLVSILGKIAASMKGILNKGCVMVMDFGSLLMLNKSIVANILLIRNVGTDNISGMAKGISTKGILKMTFVMVMANFFIMVN